MYDRSGGGNIAKIKKKLFYNPVVEGGFLRLEC
jgi:hypothetical protein